MPEQREHILQDQKRTMKRITIQLQAQFLASRNAFGSGSFCEPWLTSLN